MTDFIGEASSPVPGGPSSRTPSPAMPQTSVALPLHRYEVDCNLRGVTKQQFFDLLMSPDFDRFMRSELRLGAVSETSFSSLDTSESHRECIYMREVELCLMPFAQPATTDGNPATELYLIASRSKQKKDHNACVCLFDNTYGAPWHEYIGIERGNFQLFDCPASDNPHAFRLVLNLELLTSFGWNDGGVLFEWLGSVFDAYMSSHFLRMWETYVTALPGLCMKFLYELKHGEGALGQ